MNRHPVQDEIDKADDFINANDFDGVAACYTEDAVLVVRPGLLATGRKEIRAAHQAISDYFKGSLEVVQDGMHIIEAGDTALVMSRAVVDSELGEDSAYSSRREAIYVYRKNTSGEWLCVIDNSYGFELLEQAQV